MTHRKWKRVCLIIKTFLKLIYKFEIQTTIRLYATFDFKLRNIYYTFYILTHFTCFFSSSMDQYTFKRSAMNRKVFKKSCVSQLFPHPFDFHIIWTLCHSSAKSKHIPIEKAIIGPIKPCFTNMKKQFLKSCLIRNIKEDLLKTGVITSRVIDHYSLNSSI